MAEQAKLLAAYLAVGPDEMKRARAIDKLKSRLNQNFITFNLDEISVSAELTPESVLSSAQTLLWVILDELLSLMMQVNCLSLCQRHLLSI